MAWYYILKGTTQGPITEPDLRSLYQQNIVTPETPVWTEGMAEWLEFRSSTLSSGAGENATGSQLCSQCGKLYPEDDMLHYEQSWICAACKPLFFQRIREGIAPRAVMSYATVGRRFLAILIDGLVILMGFIILTIPFLLTATWVVGPNHQTVAQRGWFTPFFFIMEYGFSAAFEIFFIGKYGATPGKMLMRIKVVNVDGGPISYGRATGRYFAKLLSSVILYIGFLMAFWDDQKRALHDHICTTRVINTPAS